MTDPLAEREARVRAVTEANFDKVISTTHAPVKPTAVEAVALPELTSDDLAGWHVSS